MTEHALDNAMITYHGSISRHHGRRLRAEACWCEADWCPGYELSDPATDQVLVRHARLQSITPVLVGGEGR